MACLRSPSWPAGLEVMRRFLKVQPLATMQQSHQQVIVMLEPAFCSGHHRVITLLCDMLRAIYKPSCLRKCMYVLSRTPGTNGIHLWLCKVAGK